MSDYLNQIIQVRAETRHDGAPVCVAFADVRLYLSEAEASWLAANIKRTIRDMHRAEIASATPLTAEQRRQLRVGDRVVVRMDHGHPIGDTVYEVRAEPWQLGHGAWVVGLDGINGGYALDRVVGIVSTIHSRGPAATETA